MSGYDLFVSYSSRNERKALKIAQLAKQKGLKTYVAKKSLKPGVKWKEEIKQALLDSKALCLLLTPASLKSEWVLIEWGAAWILDKPIMPILSGCKVNDLPSRLKELQCTDYDHLDEFLNYVVKSLGLEKDLVFKVRRIKDTKDPQFLRSAPIYRLVGRNFRDEFDQVSEWLQENMSPKEKEILEELYYVASLKGEVVGVLYGTLYKRPFHKCFISSFVVSDEHQNCNGKVVALALVEQLIADANALDPDCSQFFFEIPRQEDKYSSHEFSRWNVLLHDLLPKWRPICFKGLDYIQPDLSKLFDKDKEKHVLLMCLYSQGQAWLFKKKEFIEDVLKFVYLRFYMEAYTGDMDVSNHTAYIRDVYERVTKLVQKEVCSEPLGF